MHEELIGKKFGMLTIVSFAGRDRHGTKLWNCVCDCGNRKKNPVRLSELKRGTTRSCGCVMHETNKGKNSTHGMTGSRIHNEYKSMMNRCYCKSGHGWKNYGGRCITVCDEWRGHFIVFYEWAMNNGYADNLSLDRIDVNGNYSPQNCRWATAKQQSNNKRTNRMVESGGIVHTVTEWSEILGINKSTIRGRLDRGWSNDEILLPVFEKGKTRENTNR